jgi:signal transduction histidine kinase
MLELRGGVGLWRSLCQSILAVRSKPVVASAFAVLAGGNFRSRSETLNRPERRASAEESRDPLHQAQKMESLGRLTSGVAHDFNNLLTVVLGNAAALRVNAETRGDAEAIRRAEMIERAAERGGRLAGQLLAYSRKQMLPPETISVIKSFPQRVSCSRRSRGRPCASVSRPNQISGNATSILGSLNQLFSTW